MLFQDVSLLSVGFVLPPEVISSEEIENRLAPVYERLRLPQGRLEGMSGIQSRRLWEKGTRLSDVSARSVRLAMQAAEIAPARIGTLIHASVCREFLEPATACRVHHLAGLPSNAWVYDLSNACLGVMNGAVQIASLIEAGVIEAGIVVGTEDSRGLLEATLGHLLNDPHLTRQSIKPAFASLTIGSGSCAWLLGRTSLFGGVGASVHGAVAVAKTQFHDLCQSDTDQAGASMNPTMQTDSEMLLEAGIDTGAEAFDALLRELQWERTSIARTVCHQVGTAHRRRMLERLSLQAENDFSTFARLGNTGSVALPTALGLGIEEGFFHAGDRMALLGIGSGLNSVMMGLTHHRLDVASEQLG
ncbi:3-oxoacyl-ACP synthase III [Pirellulaceae bacterium SH501]